MADCAGKKLLVLGGASQHCKVVKAAHELGVIVYVVDYLEDSPAKKIADYSYLIDVYSTDELVKLCNAEHIDGAISTSLDACQIPYQRLCERMGYHCFGTREQFKIFTDKECFKSTCEEYGVGTIPSYSVEDIKYRDDIVYPVFIKPADSRGSRGQSICLDKDAALKAIKFAEQESSGNSVVIERYMGDLPDFTVSYCVINGVPLLTRTGDRFEGPKGSNLENLCIASCSPSVFTDYYLHNFNDKVVSMIKGVGLKNAPIFFQGFIDHNEVLFYDPGLRFAGGEYERLLKTATGVDVIKELIVFSLLGRSQNIDIDDNVCRLNGMFAIQLDPTLRHGRISSISGIEEINNHPDISTISLRYKVGDEVACANDLRQRFAEFAILSHSFDGLIDDIRFVQDTLKVEDDDGKDMLVHPFDTQLLVKHGKEPCFFSESTDLTQQKTRVETPCETLTAELAQNLYEIQTLSDSDKDCLHLLFTDFFAAAFAGYRMNSSFNTAVENVLFSQGGMAESHVMFQMKMYPARTAAFMNSVYGHGAELDDGNKAAAGHAGVHVIPAVFALADKLKSSCNDVLLAITVGYEAYIRISTAVQPGMIKRGFHSTGMAGSVACAAACAKLCGLDAGGIENAMALATTMSSGLLSYGDSCPSIKPLNPGKAAESGVFAALLACQGIHGPKASLEGENGWFHAVSDEYDATYLYGSNHLLMHDCYFKLYPSCRHTHCEIDGGIALHKRVNPDTIESVRVYTYPNAIKLAGIKMPKNQDETKFSIPYTLASALLNGSYGISDMEQFTLTPEIVNLIERMILIPDESMENKAKGIRGARIEVLTKDGNVFSENVPVPLGDPENPLTKRDIVNKLKECAYGLVNKEVIASLLERIDAIDGNFGFSNPMAVLVQAISYQEGTLLTNRCGGGVPS